MSENSTTNAANSEEIAKEVSPSKKAVPDAGGDDEVSKDSSESREEESSPPTTTSNGKTEDEENENEETKVALKAKAPSVKEPSAEAEAEEEVEDEEEEDDDDDDDDDDDNEVVFDAESAVTALARNDVEKWIEYMDRTDAGHRLRSLCKKGDVVGLTELLEDKESGVDVNAASEEGWTCLHEIITHECQFTNVARTLLEHEAKVNTQDLHGDSPLHSALLYHNADNINLLLKHGANLGLRNGVGRCPVHVADEAETLQLLVEHDPAQIAVQDRVGNTPLHYAAVAKDKARVKLILDTAERLKAATTTTNGEKAKTDKSEEKDESAEEEKKQRLAEAAKVVNIKNNAGSTPLHLSSDSEVTTMILKAGGNADSADTNYNSPLHLAVRGRHKEIVRLLLREGNADSSLVNSAGKTPVNLAKDKEMRRILLGKACKSSQVSDTSSTSSRNESPTPGRPTKASKQNEYLQKMLETITFPTCSSPGILRKRSKYADCDDYVEGYGYSRPKAKPKSPKETTESGGSSNTNSNDGVSSSSRKRPLDYIFKDSSSADEEPLPPKTNRLRFSDVNDYSGVEVVEPEAKRVRVQPIYSELNFSSEDEDESTTKKTEAANSS